ncbi:MAG: anaerobic sulfatase maturase, partial [Armatimonadota bacterium]|nr:anaerobic sulfatase maturase [Armatimonadota bacterium]
MDAGPVHRRTRLRAFHVMTKPIGPLCNLQCRYCFYLDKEALYPGQHSWRMSDEVLESFIRQYIEAQEAPEVSFAWQGGEPTLLGLDFFRRVVELQHRYLPSGKRLINALQTNGTLLDEAWCRFLHENDFLVGLSLDGPRELHDHYRLDKKGRPTFDQVMRGLRLMQEHGVEFNILCVVNRVNAQHPVEVYRFFRDEGVRFIQFIPIVERLSPHSREVSEATVPGDDYGRFLCGVYNEWVRHDVGQVYVQLFEVAFSTWLGRGAGLCVYEPTCGLGMALEGQLRGGDYHVFVLLGDGEINEGLVWEAAMAA